MPNSHIILPNPPVGPGERAFRSLGHASITLAGVLTIIWTPVSVGPIIGAVHPELWGALLLVGGIIAAWASITGRYLLEGPALVVVATGMALYALALWTIFGSGNPNRGTQTLVITATVFYIAARVIHLYRLSGALRRLRKE